ncbi:MAG: MFS transporter [Saprospiraceae bacterium]|nr:MFS transporter [Saprospiraceae bacterium]MCB9343766.1 MFS transporter [Lewinellaceae bacterium]
MMQSFFTHWKNAYRGIPKEIWFLSFISLVNRCGGMVIAFITLYLNQKLHFTLPEVGYIMVFFGLGSFIGSYVGGKLTDKYGSFPVQLWSLMSNGVILISMYYVSQFAMMCVAVFFMAFSSEIFRPANSVAIARYCTPGTRTRSISLYRMAVNLGWAVAPAFGGLMVAFGWSYLFWVDGLTCISAAILLIYLLPKKPPVAETDELSASLQPESTNNSPYKDKHFLWFAFLTFLNVIVFMQLAWTIPIFWKQAFGWSETWVGFMSAMNGVLVFLIEMPLVFQLEGKRSQLYYVRIGVILYGLSYLFFLMPFSFQLAGSLFILAISLGEMFAMPFSTNFIYQRSSGASQGQYMAIYGIAWALANTLAPLYGTQVIANFGYNTLWILLAIQAMVSLIGFWYLEKSMRARTMNHPKFGLGIVGKGE